MKLSVCMIVKNEEVMLGGALESVKDADEIIVCDTGSTDNTIEVAKKYTDKVYDDFKWCDDFSAARNHAKSKATGDWILSIDADERLTAGGMELIREAMKTAKLCVDIKHTGANGGDSFYNIRLFRNVPEVKWMKPIHNHLNMPADAKCEAEIVFGYSPAHLKDPNRSIRILRKHVDENPDCVRERYYLAREFMYRGDYEICIKELNEYIGRSKYMQERADACLMKARCLWMLRRGDEARESCMHAIVNNANFKEAVLFMAELSWEHNAKTWRKMAEHCTNENVLFVRGG